MHSSLVLSEPVAHAMANGLPVVALESTIITHGMPYPDNLETAKNVEQAVRESGATPATIAVIDGHIHIGLSDDTLNDLAQRADVAKLSRADLAFAVSKKTTGSTTVAATMIAAHLADIAVFATGGIGGVHQGASESFDISADLHELAQTPVHVVSAGAKAILDIPKTLEVLETLGVPVIAYGQDNLPAFWSVDSGIKSPLRMDTVGDIASFIQTRTALGIKGGVLIGNPVPSAQQIPKADMDIVIEQAINESVAKHINGKSVTPWLLGRIVELTSGASLETNKALIINNAQFAAKLAQQLAQPLNK